MIYAAPAAAGAKMALDAAHAAADKSGKTDSHRLFSLR